MDNTHALQSMGVGVTFVNKFAPFKVERISRDDWRIMNESYRVLFVGDIKKVAAYLSYRGIGVYD